jgi:hypothetical protein
MQQIPRSGSEIFGSGQPKKQHIFNQLGEIIMAAATTKLRTGIHTIRGHRVEAKARADGLVDLIAYTADGRVSVLTAYAVPKAEARSALDEIARIMQALPERADTPLPTNEYQGAVHALGLSGATARAAAEMMAGGGVIGGAGRITK